MRYFLILFSAAFLFASCKYDPASATTGGQDTLSISRIFPLAYGDYWRYEIDNYDKNGAPVSKDFETDEVIDTLNFRGHHVFVIDYGGQIDHYLDYYSGQDIFYVALGDSSSQKWLHYPLSLGQQYVLRDADPLSSPSLEEVLTLKGFQVPVSVPAGNFSCVEYEKSSFYLNSSAPDFFEDDYYAPNVGLVKSELYQTNDSLKKQLTSVYKLLSYHVN